MPGATATPDEALTLLDADAVRRWAVLIRAGFAARRAEIDALNVFPVPDGDTGTNLFLTFDGALDRNQGVSGDGEPRRGAGALLADFASALLWAARGNSGVILSQLARGIADAGRGLETIDAATLARGLQRADELAWKAVTAPKEGTILSVSRAAAGAATGAVEGGLHAVAAAAFAAGTQALARTPEQLQVLADAGVVDAGGAGYVVLLECLERVCAGDEGTTGSERWGERWGQRTSSRWSVHPVSRRRTGPVHPSARGGVGEVAGPEYEVMYLLADSGDDDVEVLRRRLVELGDSVIVVGGDGEWNVHAHVDDPGAAVEAGIEAGRPHRVRITRLEIADHVPGAADPGGAGDPGDAGGAGGAANQAGAAVGASGARAGRPGGQGSRHGSAIVACVAGDGLVELFRGAGAEVVTSGPSRRASTGQIIEAIRARHATGAAGVVVLPNDADTELAAGAAVRAVADEGIEAHVVRARAAVQGVAALAVFEPDDLARVNLLAMQSAASATRHGAVTVASRSALTSAGPCEPGDVLGFVDGDIVVVGHDQQEVGHQLVNRLLSSGGELLTVVTGVDAPSGLADGLSHRARAEHLGLEVSTIDGGQSVYSVLLGVE